MRALILTSLLCFFACGSSKPASSTPPRTYATTTTSTESDIAKDASEPAEPIAEKPCDPTCFYLSSCKVLGMGNKPTGYKSEDYSAVCCGQPKDPWNARCAANPH